MELQEGSQLGWAEEAAFTIMSRSGRSLKNYLTGIFTQVIGLSIGIFSTPLLLKWLGDERFGAFRAVSDLGGYIGLLELGIGGSVMAVLANAIGKEDREQISLSLGASIRAYLQVTGLMLIGTVIVGLMLTNIVKVPDFLNEEINHGYWIGAISIFFLPLTPFRILTDASHRSYFISYIFFGQSLLITSFSLLLAWLGWGIPGQYLAGLAGAIFAQSLLCWDGLKNYSIPFGSIFNRANESQQEISKRIWQLNIPTLLWNFSGQIALLSDNLVISYYLGAEAVVPFFLTQKLLMIVQGQLQGIGNASWAGLADLYHKNEIERFNQSAIRLTEIVSLIGFGAMVIISAYNPSFVRLWVGNARFAGEGVNLLAATNGFLQGVFSLWGWFLLGTGHVKNIVPAAIISSLLNLSISLIFTPLIGITAPLIGTLVSFIIVSTWAYLVLFNQIFGISIKKLLQALSKPFTVGIPYACLVWWIARSHKPWGWIGLGAEMAVAGLCYLVLAWFLMLKESDREEWLNRLKTYKY
jgi:O-antigen/teichoic acid export membrane protein